MLLLIIITKVDRRTQENNTILDPSNGNGNVSK